NLCVVGDPDQSIYGWRGSDIRNILDFERDFPQARVITLALNYRSTPSILKVADHLIQFNRKRKPKNLLTNNPPGPPVRVITFETGLDEADNIARRIQAGVAAGRHRYRDVAVFLRINALSRVFEQAFVQQRIPYQIVRGLAFFERKENRDVLAYLRLLLNPRDDISFLRIVNEPARGIGKVSLQHLQTYAEPREIGLLEAAGQVDRVPAIKGKAATGLREFTHLMAQLRAHIEDTPEELIRLVLDLSGYRRMLQDSTDPEDADRLANIEELITAAKQFTADDDSRTIGAFLENITLASDLDGWNEEQDCVSVMTLHAAKGLEFPVVFMPAVEQGLLPHERSLKDDELEEERRLAFVGMTRAKQELTLSHSRLREFRGNTLYAVPSMFLEELPEEDIEAIDLSASGAGSGRAMREWRGGGTAADDGWLDAGVVPRSKDKLQTHAATPSGTQRDYAVGTKVQHDTYGTGRVIAVSGYGAMRKVKIRFAAAGERTFLTAKAKLTIVT
ncbi:MAG: ATP-dependent helicase, partial [Gemmataceae bacterium]